MTTSIASANAFAAPDRLLPCFADRSTGGQHTPVGDRCQKLTIASVGHG